MKKAVIKANPPMAKGIYKWYRRKFVNAFAYEIYIAATSNKSRQPTKNLHFSPSTPHKVYIIGKKKWKEKLKKKKRRYIITIKSLSSPIMTNTASLTALY